jgi:lanosterol synthase
MSARSIRKRGAEPATNGAREVEKDAALKRRKLGERTDYARWRIRDDNSDHTWIYLEDDEAAKSWPQSKAEKWHLGLGVVGCPTVLPPLAIRGNRVC